MKLENKLSAFKIQWRNSHGVEIPIPKLGEKKYIRSTQITFLKQFTAQKDKLY